MEIILGLMATVFAYMAFPVVRLILNGGKFEAQRAKKIALWNSIVVGLVFCIATIEEIGAWNGAPAVIYFFLNRAMLTEKEKEEAVQEQPKQESASQEFRICLSRDDTPITPDSMCHCALQKDDTKQDDENDQQNQGKT